MWFSLASINQFSVLPRAVLSILPGLQATKIRTTFGSFLPCIPYTVSILSLKLSIFIIFSSLTFLNHYYYPSTVHPTSAYLVYSYQINIYNYYYHIIIHPLKNLHCLEYQGQASLSEKWQPSTVQLHSTCINFISSYCL